MDREKKRMLALSIFIILVIVGSIGYFIWSAFFAKGTLVVSSEAPFSIEIIGVESKNCLQSSCEIKTKSGNQTVVFAKEGYESVIENIDIKNLRTSEINIEFKLQPFLTLAANFPQPQEGKTYKLVFDNEEKRQKLIKEGDIHQRAIVYFQNPIENPQIFSSKNTVLIIERDQSSTAYKVNLQTKTRDLVEANFSNIISGEWSDNSKHFIFSTSDSPFLKLLTASGEIRDLDLYSQNNIHTWTYNNSFLFITEQDISSAGNIIDVVETISIGTFTFGEYDPAIDTYTKIATFSDIPERPSQIIPTSNLKVIYFQAGEDYFQLNQ